MNPYTYWFAHPLKSDMFNSKSFQYTPNLSLSHKSNNSCIHPSIHLQTNEYINSCVRPSAHLLSLHYYICMSACLQTCANPSCIHPSTSFINITIESLIPSSIHSWIIFACNSSAFLYIPVHSMHSFIQQVTKSVSQSVCCFVINAVIRLFIMSFGSPVKQSFNN